MDNTPGSSATHDFSAVRIGSEILKADITGMEKCLLFVFTIKHSQQQKSYKTTMQLKGGMHNGTYTHHAL